MGTKKVLSRYTNDYVYLVYFKSLESGSYKCWVDPNNRNWHCWKDIIFKTGTVLENLTVKNEKTKLIDADSQFVVRQSGLLETSATS